MNILLIQILMWILNTVILLKPQFFLNKYEIHNRTHMETIPVTETEVINIIRALKPKGTAGYDGISNNILKLCAHIISRPLTYIINGTLTTGIFPEM